MSTHILWIEEEPAQHVTFMLLFHFRNSRLIRDTMDSRQDYI